MNEARGGVLFIDEAYGLIPEPCDSFLKETVLQFLANLTDPKYEGNMIVIIAGYTADIDALLNSNQGMMR
jgi:hypothetical protein